MRPVVPGRRSCLAPRGFVRASDARHLTIRARPLEGDPLREGLAIGAPLGLLGIEAQSRRRNRANGTLVDLDAEGFTVEVEQSFGNCPKYIQARAPQWIERAPAGQAEQRRDGFLDGRASALIERSDTFYIASAAADARGRAGADGVDVSHRGGKPGFVRVRTGPGGTELLAPDFRGNFLFNTLGNIAAYPHAGLLFVDYEHGDMLELTGGAESVWDGREVEAFAGAQRLLRVRVTSSRWFPAALPLRWTTPQQAPQLADTGTWRSEAQPPR